MESVISHGLEGEGLAENEEEGLADCEQLADGLADWDADHLAEREVDMTPMVALVIFITILVMLSQMADLMLF